MRLKRKLARIKRAIHDEDYDLDSRMREITDKVIDDMGRVDPREFQEVSACDDCCEPLIQCRCMPG